MQNSAHASNRLRLVRQSEKTDDPRLDHLCGFEKCMQCGRCTASCPAAYAYDDYRPRDLMRRLALGDRGSDELYSMIWRCGQCYSCKARCPRNNSAGSGVLALRESAIRDGKAPASVMQMYSVLRKNLYEKGETFTPSILSDTVLKKFGPRTYRRCSGNAERRVRLGYGRDDARETPVPDRSMAEIRAIMKLTGYGEDGME